MNKFKALWEIIQRASPYSRTDYTLTQELRKPKLQPKLQQAWNPAYK